MKKTITVKKTYQVRKNHDPGRDLIRPSHLLLYDILPLKPFLLNPIVTIKTVAFFDICTAGLFECLITLVLFCAQSGRVV